MRFPSSEIESVKSYRTSGKIFGELSRSDILLSLAVKANILDLASVLFGFSKSEQAS